MRRNLACLAVATLSLVVVFVACKSGPTLPPATAGGGFIIQTIYVSPSGPFAVVAGGVNILGSWVADVTGATGDPSAINAQQPRRDSRQQRESALRRCGILPGQAEGLIRRVPRLETTLFRKPCM